jgi:outer membrane immunogenic protein
MLKKSAISILAVLAGISSARAADPFDRGGLKDTPATAGERAVSWSGFYIGGQIGYGNANHDLTVQRYNGAYCWDQFGNQLSNDVNSTKLDDSTALTDGLNFNFGPDSFIKSNSGATNDGDPVGGLVYGRNDDGDCTDTISNQTPAVNDSIAVDPSSRNIANLDGLNSHGIIGGVQVGADYQMGRFVAGVFGSYNLSAMKSEGSLADFDAGFEVEKGDEWSLGGRVGFLATPRTMVYALAAYTQTEYDFSGYIGTDVGKKTVDFDGVTVGGGIEVALTNNVFLGAEYTHTFYGEETIFDTGASDVGGFGHRVIDDLDEDKIMATLKVKLNGGLLGD